MDFFERINKKREEKLLHNIRQSRKVDERAILKAFAKTRDKSNFIIQCYNAMKFQLIQGLEEAIINLAQNDKNFLLTDCPSIYFMLRGTARNKMKEIFINLNNSELMNNPRIFSFMDGEEQLEILKNADINLITPQILGQTNEHARLEFIYTHDTQTIPKDWLETITEEQRIEISKLWIRDGKISIEQLDNLIGQENLKSLVKEIVEDSIQKQETEMLNSEFVKEYILHRLCTEPKERISLPKGMTIGIEIEAEGKEIRGKLFDNWEAKEDGTLNKGTEVASPILEGYESDTMNIYRICTILKEMGFESSKQCGGHIHIGANYLTSKEAYTNLIELWGNLEEILYIISNAEGEIIRDEGASTYAIPLSGKIEKALQRGTINLEEEKDLDTFITQIKSIQETRYSGLNLLNIGTGKNTIEFRIPNGTINPEIWIQNINLFGGIIHTAERIAQAQMIPQSDRTQEQQLEIELFERLNTQGITEEEKLDIMLKLFVSEDKKQIYEKRYEVNKRILSECPKVQECLRGNITSKPIKLKQIGKKVFSRSRSSKRNRNAEMLQQD